MIADAREIQTKRLRLRPFREEDYDDLYEFLSQLKDDEFEGYPGITYENGRKHLQDRLDSTAYYAVELMASGKVIGNAYCGDREYDAKEVGFIIHRLYRRKGYGTEALAAVIHRAFHEGRTGCMPCATRGTCPSGSCWNGWACGGRPTFARTSFFTGMKPARRSGRTPSSTPF